MRWGTGVLMLVAVIGALPRGLAAQRGRAELNDGNRLYAEGRFGEAHERYLEALRDAPDLPLALFNDGNALYESEEYARALDAYLGAIESGDPALAAPAWYNLGNALYRQQRFQESAEAFKQALRIDPNQIDYKHNLELALEQQMQQPEQAPESEDGDESEQNEDSESESRESGTGAGPGAGGSRAGGSRAGAGSRREPRIKIRSPKNLRKKSRPSQTSRPSPAPR